MYSPRSSTEGPLDAVMGTGGLFDTNGKIHEHPPVAVICRLFSGACFNNAYCSSVSTSFLLKEPAYIQLYTMIYIMIYHDRIWYHMIWCDMIWYAIYIYIYIFKLHYISITIHSMYTSRTPMAHPVSSSPWPRAKKPPAQWSAARTKSTFEVRWRKTYPLVNKHRPWKSPIFNGN